MLSFHDAVSRRRPLGRRDFLRIGGASLAGVSLPMMARGGSAVPGSPVTGKSVIYLFMQGGPTQFETFDPKKNVSTEIATVGDEIATSLPGVSFSEALPKLSQHAHRLAVVRDYKPGSGHGGMSPVVSPMLCDANIGAAYSRIAGTNHPVTGLPNSAFLVPKAVDPNQKTLGARFGKFDVSGRLGGGYAPFMPGAEGPFQQAMSLNMPRERFEDRFDLLRRIDGARRELDRSVDSEGLSGLQAQAMQLVLKGVADAFDLTKEDPRTLARYDTGAFYNPKLWEYYEGGATKNRSNVPSYTAHSQTLGKLLLLARRLCEAGCGFISIHTEFVWDFHADRNNVAVPEGKKLVIEPFDHAVSAFVEDCEERGLSEEIMLVCSGEMGRTPKINKEGGRDHWPSLGPLMLYGGGLTHGQVIGESERDGSKAIGAGHGPDDVLATISHTLFDYGQARLIPSLPAELHTALGRLEKMPGVLG